MEDNLNNSQKDDDEGQGAGSEEAGAPKGSATSQQGRGAQRAGSLLTRVDHTPPPVTIESGSVIIETDEDFVSRDNNGGAGHARRHILSAGRSVEGIRILDDAGNTVYLDGEASGSSIKVWWNKNVNPEQIFVDGATLNIEADADLGAGGNINHPPGGSFKRKKQFSHPGTGGRGIEKVEVVKNSATVFSRVFDSSKPVNVQKVMIWDTTG